MQTRVKESVCLCACSCAGSLASAFTALLFARVRERDPRRDSERLSVSAVCLRRLPLVQFCDVWRSSDIACLLRIYLYFGSKATFAIAIGLRYCMCTALLHGITTFSSGTKPVECLDSRSELLLLLWWWKASASIRCGVVEWLCGQCCSKRHPMHHHCSQSFIRQPQMATSILV